MRATIHDPGYRLRSADPTDAEAVLALLVTRDIADAGAPEITLEDLHGEWRGAEFDLSADARVVETADARMSATPRAAGYRPGRSYWRLARKLDGVEEGAAPPAGVSIRPVDIAQDAAALHALNEVSFKASPDYQPYSFDAFYREHLRAHDLDPELSLVAERGDQSVGFLLSRRWPGRHAGFIDLLGVHPDHRGRGLATATLRTAFARFAAAGLREAQLGVASGNPSALRLYERQGMSKRFRYDTYERAVFDPGSEVGEGVGQRPRANTS
jgi:ribosomal protein S18 acetylase RimI-like enzyme